jgi:hypothetical protein
MIRELKGHRVYVCADDGPSLAEDRTLSGLIGDLYSSGVRLVAIPIARLGPEFLRLSSGVAGAILQKLVNYHFQVAIIGDVAQAQTDSEPLGAVVRESNRGQTVWFVEDLAALEAKLPAA